MNRQAYYALIEAAREFVCKVESGKARSKRSYRQFKEALELHDADELLDVGATKRWLRDM